ncbi:MAG TPA: GNAT family N-acetyltransferase [Steroidobacteraceae bacterium]|nr:GNAT family N-acetyltransferase [Steroidobacteraceae bacterium]
MISTTAVEPTDSFRALGSSPDSRALEHRWMLLQERGEHSYFQSWGWIGTWLECVAPRTSIRLLQAGDDANPRALALIGTGTGKRPFIRSRQLRVTETGLSDVDALTIEHNGLLLGGDGQEASALNAALRALRADPKWDEIVISALASERVELYERCAREQGLTARRMLEVPHFTIDLEAVRRSREGFLELLSSNSRAQVRRAVRGLESSGPIHVTRARDLKETLEFFDRLAAIHQAYWQQRGQPGAFHSDFARAFHHRLISTRYPTGEIDLLRVSAGPGDVAYLYNFVYRGRALNYQSGIVYTGAAKEKPGLVAHCAVVAELAARGLQTYDLLMGSQQYKRTLGTDRGLMVWLHLQRPRLRFWLEHNARAIRDRARALKTASVAD